MGVLLHGSGFRIAFGHRIVHGVVAPRMAAADAQDAHPQALQQAPFLQRFYGVLGTRRLVPALVCPQQRRKRVLINAYEEDEWVF